MICLEDSPLIFGPCCIYSDSIHSPKTEEQHYKGTRIPAHSLSFFLCLRNTTIEVLAACPCAPLRLRCPRGGIPISRLGEALKTDKKSPSLCRDCNAVCMESVVPRQADAFGWLLQARIGIGRREYLSHSKGVGIPGS